ncbi:hypothetical protein M413DRAFT_349033 [Hebeloma cylindrosporum]|uniref:DUF6534 domain-containing protein n=1 Tax=Hebeloma cylindrosporum TaxID=76867 RepID=A0A0C2Y2R4_HEBCY|nr:hypothetical protein M413DRAFT_349033 [Hebeloma cylindrosporum h7]
MAPTPLLSLTDQTMDNTLGAIVLGMAGSSMLFGITTLQTYWYFHCYPNDSALYKCSVALLWILDALHLTLVVHAVYTYSVAGFGNSAGLQDILWSIKLQASINVVIVLIVHSLYATRVWLLGGYHRGVLGYVVASVVAGGFVIGIVFSCFCWKVHTYADLESIAWLINAALGTSTTIDFVIATAMCYYLRKSKGSITRLNSRISTIMQYTLSSGIFTSACSLAAMFSYILLPNTFAFLALEFLATKLYVVSFIAMLNARERNHLGFSTFEVSATDPSWKRHLDIIDHTTSSFWSPRPQSMVSLEAAHFPPESLTKTNPPTYAR